MRKIIKAFIFLVFTNSVIAQDKNLETFYEKSGGLRTPRYDETIDYCKKLDAASPLITYTTFGISPQGRALPLLIADSKGRTDVAAIRNSGNLVLMVQACIHPGEPDGKDAGLMLLRDIVTKKELLPLLDHVSILFIPIFNVDGHERFGPYNRINQNGPEEMGWRTTAQNLNLNRDYLKADAPEMQSWLKLYNKWLPDFFIDCHVTDGADYQYVLTYAFEPHAAVSPLQGNWIDSVLEPAMIREMDKQGYPIFPYVEFRRWHDPRSGISDGVAPPMLSQGYVAARNRMGLLIESHMLKPYKQRVEGNYALLKFILAEMNSRYEEIRKLNRETDALVSGESFRMQPFPVSYDVSETDSVMVDFRGVSYTIDTSDLTGGLWFRYDNTRPETFAIPMFNKVVPDKKVMLPEAYIIPVQFEDIIRRVQVHGVKVSRLSSNKTLRVSLTTFSDAKWQPRPYEGRLRVNYKTHDTIMETEFPKGSAVIMMNQPTAQVIAHLLEPASPNSLAAWGFFNPVFEQKEYFETYVMEPIAHDMIQKNPTLKEEFEKWEKENPRLAEDQYSKLGWFYQRTPWFDKQVNLYPVGRIVDKEMLMQLK